MKGTGWLVLLLVLTLTGYGLFAWQFYKTGKVKKDALEQVQVKVQLIIAQRDSVQAAKQISLEELKQEKENLTELIAKLEKTKKKNISIGDARDKLRSL